MESTRKSKSGEDGPAPTSASAYLDPHYWDSRFAVEDEYEWFKDYSYFQHLIHRHLPNPNPSLSVLELGSGNSRLCEHLLNDGISEKLTCIDLSSVAVKKMQQRFSQNGIKEIRVLEADMLDLPFADGCFDLVIEKGTMDVLFVDSGGPWNPHPETVSKVMKMLEGVHRVLGPEGIFISISFGQPHFRRKLFEALSFTWSVEWNTFGDGFHYFFYTLKKGRRVLMGNDSSSKECTIPTIRLLHDELEDEDYLFRTCVDEL